MVCVSRGGASITVMMTYALARGVQQGEVVNSVGGRIVAYVAPRLTAAVAKPEDAGLHC